MMRSATGFDPNSVRRKRSNNLLLMSIRAGPQSSMVIFLTWGRDADDEAVGDWRLILGHLAIELIFKLLSLLDCHCSFLFVS